MNGIEHLDIDTDVSAEDLVDRFTTLMIQGFTNAR
jgi:hypothetical protein